MASTPPDDRTVAAATREPAAEPTWPALDLISVEDRVREFGAFNVIDWLLDNGLLPHERYEAWRRGELPHLESALACPAAALAEHLDHLSGHARRLGLVNDPVRYYCWRPDQAQRPLSLSPEATRARRFAQNWARQIDVGQLDLFMDSGAEVAENALREALAGHRIEEAAQAYERLCGLAPNHRHLGGYDDLLVYCRHLEAEPSPQAQACAAELAGFEAEIVPLARDLLGARARDYLAPAWRRLAAALPDEWFDPASPECHASHAWLQLPEPAAARASIEAVSGYEREPVLLLRLATSLRLQRQPAAALLVQARAIEREPETAREGSGPNGDPALRRHLEAFDDLEEAPDPADFPAWLLLQAPGLLEPLERPELPRPSGAAFEAVLDLLRARATGADEVAARERLRAASPALLRLELQRC